MSKHYASRLSNDAINFRSLSIILNGDGDSHTYLKLGLPVDYPISLLLNYATFNCFAYPGLHGLLNI